MVYPMTLIHFQAKFLGALLAKLAVHRTRRVFIPSKYQLSPFVKPHSKITVSKLEADLYGVVLRMADSNEHSK